MLKKQEQKKLKLKNLCRKIPYNNKKKALTVLNQLRSPHARTDFWPEPFKRPTKAYKCKRCKKWHLTTQSDYL